MSDTPVAGMPGTWPWLEHLNAEDRALLVRVARDLGMHPERLQHDEVALALVLSHGATFDAVWNANDDDALLRVSPFLVFAAAVHRAWAHLQGARHVDEWIGARQRLPVL